MPANATQAPPRSRLGAATAVALGFVPVTLLDAALVLRGIDLADADAQLEHMAFVIGYRAALAVLLAGVTAAIVRLAAVPRRGGLAAATLMFCVCVGAGSWVFADDLYSYLWPRRVAMTLVLSLLPAVLVVGRLIAGAVERRWGHGRRGFALLVRAPFLLVGLVVGVANHIVIPYGNPGPHLGMLVLAGVGVGMAILGAPVRPRPTLRRAALVLCAALGLWSVLARPSSDASLALTRDESAALYPYVMTLAPDSAHDLAFPDAEVDAAWLRRFAGDPAWFAPRDHAPAASPTRPIVDPERVIVLVVTIDALGWDVFADPDYAPLMPTMQALRSESTVFTRASASSSSTAPSIASIFTGRYLSEMEWTKVLYKNGQRVRYYPVHDATPRVAELLPATVDSYTAPSIERLKQQYGLLRGFRDEAPTDTEEDLMAGDILPGLTEWVVARPRAALAHVHLMDGHSPYDLAGLEGSAFERHVREYGVLDLELGAMVQALKDAGVWSRTVLILAADHGEAFGEHGQSQHGGSLHEEVTHVPMMIRVPGQPAREVDERVSLIDLGPTILDLFQRPTPGVFLGQTLVPLLAGEDSGLTRPIALESTRLHRAIIFHDDFKCIWRSREDQFELYDLTKDPDELDNLIDSEPSAPQRVAAVRRFFRAHELVRPGYVTPHYW